MPLMICPKCKKFHYVPGDCPAPKSDGLAGPALISGSSRAANTKPAPKSREQVVSRLKSSAKPEEDQFRFRACLERQGLEQLQALIQRELV